MKTNCLVSAASIALWALTAPAFAQPMTIEGVTFDVPDGYTANALPVSADGSFAVQLNPPADGPKPMMISAPTLCMLLFDARSGDAPTQEALNAAAQDPQYPLNPDHTPEQTFKTPTRDDFTLAGGSVAGSAYYGVPLIGFDKRGIYYLASADVPKGTLSLNCSVMEDDFEAALPAIRAIRDSIVPAS